MKTPAHPSSLAERLTVPLVPPDPRRLALLEQLFAARRERPGQVLAIFHSDCGLTRAFWQEVQTVKANSGLGLHEALVTRTRDDLRTWIAGLAAHPPGAARVTPAGAPAAAEPFAAPAAAEQIRLHSLRRALVGEHLFSTGWEAYDPGTDTERGVLGVRSIFERYVLQLRERVFLSNLGVLAFADWFRPPLEAVEGLDLDRFRQAMEARWEPLARHFPAVEEPDTAWAAAHRAAGELWPSLATIDRQIQLLFRRAGLTPAPTRPLQVSQP